MNDPKEKRSALRRRTLLGGTIVFNGEASTLSCLVRNLGEGGALLQFAAPAVLPRRFALAITGRGGERAARRVWVREGAMGISFVDDPVGRIEP